MQNYKELGIMTSLRQSTSSGNEGNEILWKKEKVDFETEYKLHRFRVNFKCYSIESWLIRYYTKILTVDFPGKQNH